MAVKTGVDVRTMTWWPDLLALIIANANYDDFDSRCDLIKQIPKSDLLLLDQQGLFHVVEALIGNEDNNEFFWSAQIARSILYQIDAAIDDELLTKFDMRLRRKDYSNQPLSWINSLALHLMQKKQRQARIDAFFKKHF